MPGTGWLPLVEGCSYFLTTAGEEQLLWVVIGGLSQIGCASALHQCTDNLQCVSRLPKSCVYFIVLVQCNGSDCSWAGQLKTQSLLLWMACFVHCCWEFLHLGIWGSLLFHPSVTVKLMLNNSEKSGRNKYLSILSSPFLWSENNFFWWLKVTEWNFFNFF